MSFDIFTYVSSLAFIYIYSRLAIHYAPLIFQYFINSIPASEKYLEKPRILFHFLGLSFMHLMFYYHKTHRSIDITLDVLALLIFFLGIFFCLISWGEKFKYSFSGKRRTTAIKTRHSFNLSISDLQATALFNNLVRFDLIDQERTSIEDFKNVLLRDWNSHNSKIHLRMDGPSCREFYDHLIKVFPNNSITLKNLFVTSDLIRRPDGKPYKYNTLKNSPTRTPMSKQNEVLKIIFEGLK